MTVNTSTNFPQQRESGVETQKSRFIYVQDRENNPQI